MGTLTLYLFDGIIFSSRVEAMSYEEFSADKERLAQFRDSLVSIGLDETDIARLYQEYMARQPLAQPNSETPKAQPSRIAPVKATMAKLYRLLAPARKSVSAVARKIGWCPREEQIGVAAAFSMFAVMLAGLSQLIFFLERKARL